MSEMSLRMALNATMACVLTNVPAMLHGKPGIGKSQGLGITLPEMLKQETGEDWYAAYFNLANKDLVEVIGLPDVDRKSGLTNWLPPSDLPHFIRDRGKRGLLILDELPQASPAMQKLAMPLALERRIGGNKLPDGCVPVAAGNNVEDRAGAMRLNTALANRFKHFWVKEDVDTWCEWALKSGKIRYDVYAYIRFRRAHLHVMPKGNEYAYPTPRGWEDVSKLLDYLEKVGRNNSTYRLPLVCGAVGDVVGSDADGFWEVYRDLPTQEEVERDPKNAKLPADNKMGAMLAVSSMLGRCANKGNIAAFGTYSARLPKEYDVLMFTDAVAHDESIKKTKAYSQWATRNHEVQL